MGGRISIGSDGLTAKYAAYRTSLGRRQTPLAAVHADGRVRSVFVQDELIADAADDRTMAALRQLEGVRIGEPWQVPAAPDGMDPARARPLDGMPQLCTVTFDGSQVDHAVLGDALTGSRTVQVSSVAGAGTLARAVQLRRDGARVLPNAVGRSVVLPKGSSAEQGGVNPYTWWEFNGRTRFTRAWQIIDAYRQLTGRPSGVVMGIVDGGYWINPDGRQGSPAGQKPEFREPVLQWNLNAEGKPAGGANEADGPAWHGQMVASLACAPHDDSTGIAGAGGTIATPFLFKCDLSCKDVIRAVQAGTAWGIDVMNMSFAIQPGWAPFDEDEDFDEDAFNDMFAWAAGQGMIIVCGAGNENSLLPDYDIRPATRTPGVITVGGLMPGPASGDVRWLDPEPTIPPGTPAFEAFRLALDRPGSNYGSSVNIWAPAWQVHVGPTPSAPTWSQANGTSGSAPLVAGAVAMMKYVRPELTIDQALDYLTRNGWRGSVDQQVTVGLDAAAAVWDLIGSRLPNDLGEPAGGSPQTALPLARQQDGSFLVSAPRAISRLGDVDWYSFTLDDFYQVTVDLRYAKGLGEVSAILVADDVEGRSTEGLTSSRTDGRFRIDTGLMAPGTYRVKVFGQITLYELSVATVKGAVQPDAHEPNNTMRRATTITFAGRPKDGVIDLNRFALRTGGHEFTLHHPDDTDHLHFVEVPTPIGIFNQPVVEINRTDAGLRLALLDAAGNVRQEWPGTRRQRVELPAGEAWLRVSTVDGRRTRYGLVVSVTTDRSKLPGPWQEVDLTPLPDWWPEGDLHLHGWERYLQVVIDEEVVATPGLRLTGTPGLTLHLLDESGDILRTAVVAAVDDLRLPLDGVPAGSYVLRVGRAADAARRLAPAVLGPARFRLGPIL